MGLACSITRDERQLQCMKAWKAGGGKGTLECCTGFGKTRIATTIILKLLNSNPLLHVIVVVPTDVLKEQWEGILEVNDVANNCNVVVINTASSHNYKCDLLVIDEIHRSASICFSNLFKTIKYKLVLGLTATLERLDERHKIIEKYCPIVDRVPIEVAKLNGWVSDYTEYQVLIHVSDIETYNELNKEFNKHFEFFGYNFPLCMQMVGKNGLRARLAYRDLICKNGTREEKSNVLKQITLHATGFMRIMQARKKFVQNHPDKIKIAQAIINARSDKKIITFSGSVKMAEAIGVGDVYTGKVSKKRSPIMIENFSKCESGVLNSCAKLNEGLDVKGVSVAIILGLNSSSITAKQRTGRAIRKEGNKFAEIFNLVIAGTVEEKWFANSHKDTPFKTIDVNNLHKLLNGEEFELYSKPMNNYQFRF